MLSPKVIIDFHAHVVPPWLIERRQDWVGRDATFSELYANPKARLATAEDLIASMDRAGVDVSVISNMGWASHQLCVDTNSYIMEAVARYPQRLVGFGVVQPQAGAAALREMERCAQGGLRGIGELMPDPQGFALEDSALMNPIAKLAGRLGLAFLVHASEPVGHSYAGKGRTTPERLYPFIAAHPELDIVLAHWGGGLPFYALMPEVAPALSRVYFDTAASQYLYRPQIFSAVGQLVGVEKILSGSDFPLVKQERMIELVRSLDLGDAEKGLILGGNAQRLLRMSQK